MGFQPILNKPIHMRFNVSIRKVQWVVALEEDVKHLRNSIGTGLDTINILLQLEVMERGVTAQEDVTRIRELAQKSMPVLERIEQTVNQSVVSRKHIDDVVIKLSSIQQQLQYLLSAEIADQIAASSSGLSATLVKTATKDQIDKMVPLLKVLQSRQDSERIASIARDQEILELRRATAESQRMLVSIADDVLAGRASSRLLHSDVQTGALQDDVAPDHQSAILHIQTFTNMLREGRNALLFVFLIASPIVQAFMRPLGAIIRNPRLLTDTRITFIDALNRELSLDYEHFCYWPVLLARLQVQFKGLPGEELVARSRFALLAQPERAGKGTLIPTQDWERSIFPGCRIVMSMLVDQQPHHTKTCVNCGSEAWYEYGTPLWYLW